MLIEACVGLVGGTSAASLLSTILQTTEKGQATYTTMSTKSDKTTLKNVVKDLQKELAALRKQVEALEENQSVGGVDYESTQSTQLANRLATLEEKLDDVELKRLIGGYIEDWTKTDGFRDEVLKLLDDRIKDRPAALSGSFTDEQLKARGNFHSLSQLDKSIYREGVEK